MSDKLPEWPEQSAYLDPVYTQYFLSPASEASYYEELADAALARIAALVEVVNDLIDEKGRPAAGLMARINELLAACERRSGG